MNPNGPVQTPDLRALLNAHRDEISASINCVQIGKVVSYDAATISASVQIQAKRVVFNKVQEGGALQQTPMIYDYPILTDVPVHFPAAGGAILYMPLAEGDLVIVLFNDRDLDAWFESNTAAVPNSPRMHSLSDGICLPGIFSKGNPPAVSGADVVLKFGTVSITLAADGSLKLTPGVDIGNFILMNADGTMQIVATGLMQIISTDTNKIQISNGINSLKGCLDGLCDVLTAWVNTGGSTPNPATIAAIAAAKAQIDGVFQ